MAKDNEKEWTLMFYFASDNPLAPGIVSQLKALQNAGYHPQANVIAQFDPHDRHTPVHIFDVNHTKKLEEPGHAEVGFRADDPFVRNLVIDKLWAKNDRFWDAKDGKSIRENIGEYLNNRRKVRRGKGASSVMYDPPMPSVGMHREHSPGQTLDKFLDFCRKNYPARHYMLFILGHGVIVGNDMFLFDEHADKHSLKLNDLGSVLGKFKKGVKADGAEFELIGFHSCSMSSLEVAYELKDTANYMLSSQGPAFVGSWPYTKILIRILNDLKHRRRVNPNYVKETLKRIFFYCLYNSYDFQLAGYSYDLCLCDLKKVPQIDAPLQALSLALINGVKDPLTRGLILLAHWDAQSFWHETYTDFYDFCFCLQKRCEEAKAGSATTIPVLEPIIAACTEVISVLTAGSENDDDRLIVRAAFAGPAYQYSHGLSVFFPWSEPTNREFWKGEYSNGGKHKPGRESYGFSKTLWDDFLQQYFQATQRRPFLTGANAGSLNEKLLEQMACLIFNEEGQLGKGSGSDETGKGSGSDETGDGCGCTSIKNYPSFTRERGKKGKKESIPALSPSHFRPQD